MTRKPADFIIQIGFWSHLFLLVLIDWATIASFRKHGAPWQHRAGFVAVNVALVALMAATYGLLRRHQRGRQRPIGPASAQPTTVDEAPPAA